jgi:hypothetical protein
LPAWAASRIASLKNESQPDETGRWRQVLTIPTSLILKANEREAVEQHVIALDRLCEDTPQRSARAQKAMLVILTQLMWVSPSTTQNELSAEARGAGFMMALDDITVWAVQAAVRNWCRGNCGTDTRGRPYDYRWCPAPAELRRIAFIEMWRIQSRAADLRRLLRAVPRKEYLDEHCRVMREQLITLFPKSRTSPVGKDGSGGVAGR